ncbi:hypothetical protein RAM07_03930 [Lactobacillus helsingborgensis]|nr:hypothetical protein [Lactobacillus helsingborgensis]WLT01101.1 hypothetical protein RAM07_03930 [Lactobacillus helsingborgensis]
MTKYLIILKVAVACRYLAGRNFLKANKKVTLRHLIGTSDLI